MLGQRDLGAPTARLALISNWSATIGRIDGTILWNPFFGGTRDTWQIRSYQTLSPDAFGAAVHKASVS